MILLQEGVRSSHTRAVGWWLKVTGTDTLTVTRWWWGKEGEPT